MIIEQIREQVKLRQEHLKKHGHDVKLSDLYECISWENGFKNWNTFKSHLENNKAQNSIEEFIKHLLKIKDCLYDLPMRDLLIKETHLTKEMLANLTKSLRDIFEPIVMRLEKSRSDVSVCKQDGQKIFEPLVANIWEDANAPKVENIFFKNMKNFYGRLKAMKSHEGVCWSCGVVYDNTHYPYQILFFNVNKDLRALDHRTQKLNDQIFLCVDCGFHYMAEFNSFSQPAKEQALFDAAQVIFHSSGYLPKHISDNIVKRVLVEAKASLNKK